MNGALAEWSAQLNAVVTDLERRLARAEARADELEARLDALDESYVRPQQQNERDLAALERTVDRVGGDVRDHEWRAHR
jgi:predicted RNase H-like nuclease (RuvC/YqgF family)